MITTRWRRRAGRRILPDFCRDIVLECALFIAAMLVMIVFGLFYGIPSQVAKPEVIGCERVQCARGSAREAV
jgi:hypothetical protein